MGCRDVLDHIYASKIVAIVRGVSSDDILDTARALKEGGITCLEVTFDHKSPRGIENTLRSIEMLTAAFGKDLCIGAGTVLTPEQVDQAAEAGARYMISPDAFEGVIRRTKELDKVSMPGAFSATEAVFAHRCGADIVKLFPLGELGVGYLKALRGPLGHIPFAAVGGVNEENAREFLQAGAVCLGVGGNLVSLKAIAEKDYHQLTRAAKRMVKAVQ